MTTMPMVHSLPLGFGWRLVDRLCSPIVMLARVDRPPRPGRAENILLKSGGELPGNLPWVMQQFIARQ